MPYDPEALATGDAAEEKQLLRAMAVAGFAAGNIMLLSVAVWAGHAQGMGAATRGLLHWFSALIALPTIVYAGRPFFASAWGALRHRRTNMDVPISLGVLLAAAMSLARDHARRRARLFRFRGDAACSSCWSAAISTAAPAAAPAPRPSACWRSTPAP